MGLDDDGVGGGVSGDNGLRGLTETASEATLVNECSDVSSSEGARSECLFHCVGNVGFTVQCDEPLKFVQLVFEVDASAGNFLYVDAALVRERSDSVASARPFGGRASIEHCVDVGAVLNGLTTPPTALVLCNHKPVGNNSHRGVVGTQ